MSITAFHSAVLSCILLLQAGEVFCLDNDARKFKAEQLILSVARTRAHGKAPTNEGYYITHLPLFLLILHI